MMNKLKFKTFEEFCNRADEILEYFKIAVMYPGFSIKEYQAYIYNHKFSNDKNVDTQAKDKCWVWLMSYKYEKVNKNDLYCVLGMIKREQLKK